jgi:hypothetical protein
MGGGTSGTQRGSRQCGLDEFFARGGGHREVPGLPGTKHRDAYTAKAHLGMGSYSARLKSSFPLLPPSPRLRRACRKQGLPLNLAERQEQEPERQAKRKEPARCRPATEAWRAFRVTGAGGAGFERCDLFGFGARFGLQGHFLGQQEEKLAVAFGRATEKPAELTENAAVLA